MQQLTDLRRQTAATSAEPLGLSTWWPRVWAKTVGATGTEVSLLREKIDTRYHTPIQDLDPGSSSFGRYIGAYEDPFTRGPI